MRPASLAATAPKLLPLDLGVPRVRPSAARTCADAPEPRRRRRPARVDALEVARERAANLALAIAGVVRKLQAGRGTREELREQGQRDLQELEALLGIADVVLPASAPERGSPGRRAWEGFAPPASAADDGCALAVWAALDVPVEEVVLTWRATLAGVDPPPRGDGDAAAHELEGSGYAERRLDATARVHLTGPR